MLQTTPGFLTDIVKRHSFKEGDFYIIPWGSDFPESVLLNPSIICHLCPTTIEAEGGVGAHMFWSNYNRLADVCWRCQEPIPQNVKTLWILQNYDHLDMKEAPE
jgi:hypothetical protein